MILTVDLEPKDFDKIIVPPTRGGVFFVTTGPDYLFMEKVAAEVDKVKAPKLDGYMVKLRFENADGSAWGTGIEWPLAKPKDFFKKGKWGTAFVLKRLWVKQQFAVISNMGFETGGIYLHGGEMRERFGTPARFTAEFEVKMSLLKSIFC